VRNYVQSKIIAPHHALVVDTTLFAVPESSLAADDCTGDWTPLFRFSPHENERYEHTYDIAKKPFSTNCLGFAGLIHSRVISLTASSVVVGPESVLVVGGLDGCGT
jgi:hypothetical protein